MNQDENSNNEHDQNELEEAWFVPCDADGNIVKDEPVIIIRIHPPEDISREESEKEIFSLNQIPLDRIIQSGSELAEYMYLNKNMIFEAVGKSEYLENMRAGRLKMLVRKKDGLSTGTLVDNTGKFRGQIGFKEDQVLKPKALIGSVFSIMSLVTAQYYLADISKQLENLNNMIKESLNRQQNATLSKILGTGDRLKLLARDMTDGYLDNYDISQRLALSEQDLTNSIQECLGNIKANKALNQLSEIKAIFSNKTDITEIFKLIPDSAKLAPLFVRVPYVAWWISGGLLGVGSASYVYEERKLGKKRKNVYELGIWERGIKDILMLVTAIDLYHLYHQLKIQWMILSDNYSEKIFGNYQDVLESKDTIAMEARQYIDNLRTLLGKIKEFDEPFYNIWNKNMREQFIDSLNSKHVLVSDLCKQKESQLIKMRIQVDKDGKLAAAGKVLKDLPAEYSMPLDQYM